MTGKTSTEVSVTQKDGEVRVAHAGGEPTVYPVTDGKVTVKNEDLSVFLRLVDGASAPKAAVEKATSGS